MSYCVCISCELLCINWNEPQAAAHITQAAFERVEYELVDAERVCPGIRKVRVGPTPRSAVATCYTNRFNFSRQGSWSCSVRKVNSFLNYTC